MQSNETYEPVAQVIDTKYTAITPENELPSFKVPIARNIPQELKDLKQWVLWQYQSRGPGEKLTKVPYQVRAWNTGRKPAKTNDPNTWGYFESAYNIIQNEDTRGEYSGLGFVFSSEDNYVGVDIDHVNDVTGMFNFDALQDINKLSSYSEYSPSGTGAHVIVKGTKPPERCRSGNWEMYQAGRYFTFTGNRIEGSPESINESPEALKNLYNTRIKKEEASTPKNRKTRAAEIEKADSAIIKKCSERTGKFSSLFYMQWEDVKIVCPGYPSPSEADQALLTLIANETQVEMQIIRVFKESTRYRPEKGEDYLKRSAFNALKHVMETRIGEDESKKNQSLYPFYITPHGVIYLNEKGEEKIIIDEKTEITGVSDNLDIDPGDTNNSRYTHYRVNSGDAVMFPTHGDLLTRSGITKLISSGLMATESNSDFINRFFLKAIKRARDECEILKTCNHPGWKRNKTFFVSGDTVYSETNQPQSIKLLDAHSKIMYDKAGTVDEWMNPSLIKWICYDTARICCYIAVSGFISSFLGLPNTVASITGRTTGGKTTCVMVAGSLIGRTFDGKYIIRSANITPTAAEKLSISIDSHFIVFDETKTGKDYEALIYLLANGRARGRAPDSKLEEAEGFSASYIFTGESDLLKETVAQGANGRLISIKNEVIKSEENAEIAKDIEDIVQKSYGHVKDLFIKKMMANKPDLQSRYRVLATEFRAKDKDIGARIGDTLACVCLAGELLEDVFADIGVPVMDCKSLCIDVLHENISSDQKKEYWLRGLELVYNEVSTWQHLRGFGGEWTDTLLFNNKIGGKDSTHTLYVSEAAMKKVCADNNLDKKELLNVWREKDLIVYTPTGPDGRQRHTQGVRIEEKVIRCVSFKRELLDKLLDLNRTDTWGDIKSENA